MKKILLGLLLIISTAFAYGQQMDYEYKSDSVEYVKDITDTSTVAYMPDQHATFNFKRSNKCVVTINGVTDTFKVTKVVDVYHIEPDTRIVIFEGYLGSEDIWFAIRRDGTKLYSVGIFHVTYGNIFYIKQKHDLADDARTLRWMDSRNTPGIWHRIGDHVPQLP